MAYLEHLKKKADSIKPTINAFDSNGCTSLSYVCRNGNDDAINILLHSLHADINIYKPEHSPLCEAVKSCNIKAVQILLEYDAHVDQCDENQNTALHNAVLVQKHHIVELLLSYSANCHIVNSKQQTPLHLAVDVAKKQTNRSFRVERCLLEAGADINATDFLSKHI